MADGEKNLLVWLCAGFGAGFLPWVPGTAGSLVGIALGVLLFRLSYTALLLGVAAVTIVGFLAITRLLNRQQADADPGWIVIDEIAGQMLALLALRHLTWWAAAAAFFLFRLFDIAKPGPVGWADRQGGAFGIMADDLAAGLCVVLCAAVLRALHATN